MTRPRILVTAPTGKTGALVVRQALAAGFPVRAMVRPGSNGAAALAQEGAEVVEADYFDPEQVTAALTGVQRAYFVPLFDPFMVQSAVVFATAAREAQVEQIVQMSQFIANPRHPALLTRQIWLTERLFAMVPGTAHTVIAAAFFADNFLRLLDFASLLGVYPIVTGKGRCAPISNEDAARAVVAVLADPEAHRGKRYTPTGPKLLSAHDMAQIISHHYSAPVLPVEIPFWLFNKTARMQGVDAFEISAYRHYVEDCRNGVFETGGGVSDDLRALTGTPAEAFEITVARYAAMPFAKRTLWRRLKAFADFNRTPFVPAWNFEAYERHRGFPLPASPRLSSNDELWKRAQLQLGGSAVFASRVAEIA